MNFTKMVVFMIKVVITLRNNVIFTKTYYKNIFNKITKALEANTDVKKYSVIEYKDGKIIRTKEKSHEISVLD